MAESNLKLLQTTAAIFDSDNLSCRICLQILDDPIRLPCQHRFCKECLDQIMKTQSETECPICREKFSSSRVHNDVILKMQMSSSRIKCENCREMILADGMRSHELSCQPAYVQARFVAPGNRVAPPVCNRSTFSCPYCSEPNLTADNLVEHCNKKHMRDKRDMVCPVCASMPWGDPQMKSANFIEHLNRRHKFEYDTYVDYGQSDEEMLQAALAASLGQS